MVQSFFLKSFGCKVNQYDGQSLREQLTQAGMEEAASWREADLLILNFCVVTGRSASRCLRVMNSLKKRRPEARLIVGGCLSPDDRFRVKAARPDAILLDEHGQPMPFDFSRAGLPCSLPGATSAYLLGDVSVGIVLMESVSPDPGENTEDWSADRQDEVIAEIVEAADQLAVMYPDAGLDFFYDKLQRVALLDAESTAEQIN